MILFTLSSALASVIGLGSCEKVKEYAPRITVESPKYGKSYNLSSDSILLKYSIEDADNLASVEVKMELDCCAKYFPGGIRPGSLYYKTENVSSSIKEIVFNEKVELADDALAAVDFANNNDDYPGSAWLYVSATDSKGDTYKYRLRFYVK